MDKIEEHKKQYEECIGMQRNLRSVSKNNYLSYNYR